MLVASRTVLLGTLALFALCEKEPRPWDPKIRAEKEGDGANALVTVRVLAPSPCFVTAGTVEGPPPGNGSRPEWAPLRLLVSRPPGATCPERGSFLSFRRERLAVAGKSGVVVWVVLDGKVVAAGAYEF
jgi:hypothetical protein